MKEDKIKGLPKLDKKEFSERNRRLNEISRKNIKDLYKWFKDAGRPLK